MGTEVERASSNVQTTAMTPSSTTSSGPKTSMFAKKAGFVIPKNKLSGSLVPVFRGNKKGDGDLANDDTINQVQRKTKWGPDLTMDTTVRKGRASAYQTRINQISQMLTLGTLELDDNEDSQAASDHQLSKEESELLELEKREIIGELLKLNPTYKAPADYKPLLKEAKVPIPTKEYPGYNFIGLVFGPASDTLKRLEKETGAKIRVYGTKADTGGKVEVTPSDGKEVDNACEDMYVHVSADVFEKVDAAVALIELLVTPVSVNSASSLSTSAASGDMVNATNLSQSISSSIITPPMISQGMAKPYAGSFPPAQGQFPQFPQTWFSAGPTQSPAYPQSGLITPANSTGLLGSNSVQVSSMTFNPSNMPSLFGVRPANFNPVMQNSSATPSTPQQPVGGQPPHAQQAPPLGQTGGPRNTIMPGLQPGSTLVSLAGPPHNLRPVLSASLQPAPPAPAAGESARWLPPPMGTPASQGPNSIMPMTPPVVPPHGQNLMSLHSAVSGAPPVSYPNNMISPLSGASQSTGPQQPHGGFSSVLPAAVSDSTPPALQPSPMGPQQHGMPHLAMHAPSPNALPGPAPRLFPQQSSASHPQPGMPNSFSGSAPNFDSINSSSMGVPRPQQPSSGDFTFQPHRLPPHPASQVWPSSQPHLNTRPPVQAGRGPLAPQPPFRPLVHNLNSPPVQGFPRPQVNQPRGQIPPNFAGTPPVHLVPPRHPTLPGQNVSMSGMQQPRIFAPPHPINSNPGPFPPRPGNQMHIQELPGAARPQRFPAPHHVGNHPGRPFASSSGQQQVYDPFSPTAAAFNPQMGGNAGRAHGESDPEYEDLMASVGVK